MLENCSYPLHGVLSSSNYALLSFLVLLVFSILLYKISHVVQASKIETTFGSFSLKKLNVVGLGLLYLGGLPNIYQRVMYSCVVDNINFFGFFYMNIFDLIVVMGVLILIANLLFQRSQESV